MSNPPPLHLPAFKYLICGNHSNSILSTDLLFLILGDINDVESDDSAMDASYITGKTASGIALDKEITFCCTNYKHAHLMYEYKS